MRLLRVTTPDCNNGFASLCYPGLITTTDVASQWGVCYL